ncbi:MAG: hypothetical protein CMI84_00435 [Candidatus Pelagibacter sp.]|nr:hypothetical protein [Candidatus Pelagibacter sp.]|tara:strand:+ start:959 stop:1279 length:321 start_codon:yes stop_codon:yes gene_type:complete
MKRILNLKVLYLFTIIILLCGCQSVVENLSEKKRSDQGDEFLVKKKNSLEMPPDFNELPKPIKEEEEISSSDTNDEIKVLLEVSNEEIVEDGEATDLEILIIKKIQ